jgi:hypothetical protein
LSGFRKNGKFVRDRRACPLQTLPPPLERVSIFQY